MLRGKLKKVENLEMSTVKNEKCTLKEMEYVEKTENLGK
ncbi:hypothetical protein T4B_4782 [Trichinella pseudospiralis]|uniref:Uncharacterized protein n=1 Tax=Trichinella pseudospiralis TaxID=6337 RepID=A0A0V1GBB3_TRIPS|nr:hypothetical protein T4B_4782 [Trichinella pseudospiralis]